MSGKASLALGRCLRIALLPLDPAPLMCRTGTVAGYAIVPHNRGASAVSAPVERGPRA